MSDPNDPWAEDLLDRAEIGRDLERYLLNRARLRFGVQNPHAFVFGVLGGYGTGKSFFLKCFEQQLRQRHAVARMDAWQSDTLGEPFIAIIDALESALKDYLIDDSPLTVLARRKAAELLPAVRALLWGGLKQTGKRYAGEGLAEAMQIIADVDAKVAEKVGEDIAAAAVDELDKVPGAADAKNFARLTTAGARTELAAFRAARAGILQLADGLRQIVTRGGSPASIKPIFIIIDELDRCRPDYALQVLEEVKHLFDVPGLVFILGMEPNQLAASIRGIYGDRFEAERYLERFFHHRMQLPEANVEQFILTRLAEDPLDERKFTADLFGRTLAYEIINGLISATREGRGLTLREMDRALETLRASSLVTSTERILSATMLVVLMAKKNGWDFSGRKFARDPVFGVHANPFHVRDDLPFSGPSISSYSDFLSNLSRRPALYETYAQNQRESFAGRLDDVAAFSYVFFNQQPQPQELMDLHRETLERVGEMNLDRRLEAAEE